MFLLMRHLSSNWVGLGMNLLVLSDYVIDSAEKRGEYVGIIWNN